MQFTKSVSERMFVLNNNSFFTKNTSARIGVCLLLFIPLVLAIIFASHVDPNEVSGEAVKSLTVTYNGTTTTYNDEEIFGSYSALSNGAVEITGEFRDLDAETPYEITFTEADGSVVSYKLYMLEDASDCIFTTSSGKYYMMAPETASALLERPEFSGVNHASLLPVATYTYSSNPVTLTPSTYTWTYKNLQGATENISSDKPAENPVIKYNSTNPGMLSFDKQPDEVKVVLSANGQKVFDDVFENLSMALSYTSDTKLSMTITAQWYEIDGADYHGTLTYNLDFLYDIAPTYTVVDNRALPKGDFTVLRITDFNDGETLSVSTDLGIPETASVFGKATDPVKYAFIPLPFGAENGKHSITYTTSDGHSTTVEVSLKDAQNVPGSQIVIVTDQNLQSAFTSDGLAEWENKVKEITSVSDNDRYWTDKFVYPTGSSKTVSGGASYGMLRDVKSLYTTTYTSHSMALAATAGQDIKAANNGKVVFAENLTFTGLTVIIDHGSGVFSFYENLSEISVTVGQTVEKDSVIAKAGATGFACNESGTNLSMTGFAINIGGVFIDPTSPCRYGIKLGEDF